MIQLLRFYIIEQQCFPRNILLLCSLNFLIGRSSFSHLTAVRVPKIIILLCFNLRYIYATANVEVPYILTKSERPDAWSSKSNWMGYVAVTTDENEIKRLGRRDILIVWRGTQTGLEWAANFADRLIPASITDASKHGHLTHIKVEAGFFSLYTSAKEDSEFNKISAQDQLEMEIKKLIELYKNEELSITVAGHSLGSALATLSAYDLAESGFNKITAGEKKLPVPITVYSFAGPRVGNSAFQKRIDELGVHVLRMVNVNDKVPKTPGLLVNENVPFLAKLLDPLPWTYSHVGVELELNDKDSMHLNQEKSGIWTWHNLEVYLHLVDGRGRYDNDRGRNTSQLGQSPHLCIIK